MLLAKQLYLYLINKRHDNGTPIAKIYGWKCDIELCAQQGDIVNFNLLRDDGSVVGFVEVEKMCDLFGIELRTGCLCNQGACSSYLSLDETLRMQVREMGKVCEDEIDIVDGQPLGSVRISFGRLNTVKDVEAVIRMIECCFVNKHIDPLLIPNLQDRPSKRTGRLTQIFVYPIKSCGSFTPPKWQLSRTGLKFDRNWMVVGAEGVPLTQKRYPTLCSIQPEVFMAVPLCVQCLFR
jgi:molybdenum cofactor sulfurtransferase